MKRTPEERAAIAHAAIDLVLCQTADGWSLHAPGSTDEQIADGSAAYIITGEGEPTDADYDRAFAIWSAAKS